MDINDWRQHTTYSEYRPTDDVIVWFWELVESLSEEEKALLLKFATGVCAFVGLWAIVCWCSCVCPCLCELAGGQAVVCVCVGGGGGMFGPVWRRIRP